MRARPGVTAPTGPKSRRQLHSEGTATELSPARFKDFLAALRVLQSNRSPTPQLALFRNSLMLFVQIPDPIFELAVGALWQTCSYHVYTTGRNILAALIWPVSHHLADAELVGRHFVPRCHNRTSSAIHIAQWKASARTSRA